MDDRHFRHVLGHFPTGVAAVCGDTDGGPVGMAVNSLTSLSLEPPLILFCPAKSSTTWPHLDAAEELCISILADHQEETSGQFSRRGADRFDRIAWHRRRSGPALDEALAWIDCRVSAQHDGGDHLIVVAEVLDLEAAQEGRPLVFFRGGYGTIPSLGAS